MCMLTRWRGEFDSHPLALLFKKSMNLLKRHDEGNAQVLVGLGCPP